MGIKLSIGRQCLFLSHQTVGKFIRYRGLSGNLFNFSLGETTDKLHPPVKSSGTDLGLATLSCFTIAGRTLHRGEACHQELSIRRCVKDITVVGVNGKEYGLSDEPQHVDAAAKATESCSLNVQVNMKRSQRVTCKVTR